MPAPDGPADEPLRDAARDAPLPDASRKERRDRLIVKAEYALVAVLMLLSLLSLVA
ncbi:hypothetical protein [Croceibacterium aestuarii]|uniref:hypothetical protein n=1 Tax=Croceibacterium aestuarii TaxID=3064139 RepID=UPI00272EA5FF|nr:hypothetical protein [Croceibacterium sp. D39]